MIEEVDPETPQDALVMPAQAGDVSPSGDASPEAKSAFQICRFDFVLGRENTNVCDDTVHEKITEDTTNSTGHIIGLSMCQGAADQTGAVFSHDTADIGKQDQHPKGCFKGRCKLFNEAAEEKTACFFYNGMGGEPTDTVEGTPVCSRPKLVTGSANAQGCKAVDTDYKVIDDEVTCEQAQNCMGTYARADEFRIGVHNASKKLDFLTGCVIAERKPRTEAEIAENKPKNIRVHYNDKIEADVLGNGVPGHVKGTNICTVSAPLQF